MWVGWTVDISVECAFSVGCHIVQQENRGMDGVMARRELDILGGWNPGEEGNVVSQRNCLQERFLVGREFRLREHLGWRDILSRMAGWSHV